MNGHQRTARRLLAEHQAIAERLEADPPSVINYALSNLARWAGEFTSKPKPQWITEWELLLTGPWEELMAVLTDETETASRLRDVSPFVGLLTPQEHLELLRRVDPEMARAMEAYAKD